jgi:hypothetical protein
MRPRNLLRSLIISALGITALMALGASPAFATVSAHWNVSPTSAHWKGAVTLEAEGGSSVTCSNVDMRVETFNKSNQGYAKLTALGGEPLTIACPNSTIFELCSEGDALFTGTQYHLNISSLVSGFFLESPLGGYAPSPVEHWIGVVTNGSGSTPSKITFSKEEIGKLENGSRLFISGTLNLTTATGGLLTLTT